MAWKFTINTEAIAHKKLDKKELKNIERRKDNPAKAPGTHQVQTSLHPQQKNTPTELSQTLITNKST
ncbi:hypothetical protein [[Leptolyngbya] sp. PCC 7376]|uniref:hypothetical protein n=1 Tax=[Leptolyngbya] sp. PCC 7376 TaxID=111781 RepID=UPI0002EB453E|nr:hypothetical protein [[Leptolyngbya] sp. PCC 7376]